MKLPKAPHPFFDTTIPSTGKRIQYRPMLGREEKILLMAKESANQNEIMAAIKQVVQNCITEDINADELATVDIDWLFLKVRSVSNGQKVAITYTDRNTGIDQKFEVDLNDVKIVFPATDEDRLIKLTEQMGVRLRYPRAEIYGNPDMFGEDDNVVDRIMAHCIDKIFDGNQIYNVREYSFEDVQEFMDSMSLDAMQKFRLFLNKLPHLSYKLKIDDGTEKGREIELRSLSDFFAL